MFLLIRLGFHCVFEQNWALYTFFNKEFESDVKKSNFYSQEGEIRKTNVKLKISIFLFDF